MEAIALLGGVKLLIDFFEGNYTGVATGILLPPGINETYTLGDSVYYLFDTNGNRIGTKNISGIRTIPMSSITLTNKSEVEVGLRRVSNGGGFNRSNDNIGFTKY